MANTLINNVVLGEVIGAELPGKLKFAPIAKVDTTLTGVAGDTIKVEKYGYIGEAGVVAEGQPIPVSDLAMTSTQVVLKKAGKGVKLTDEEVQRRGNEVIEETKKQLTMSLKDKIDSDCYTALQTTKLVHNCTGKISFADVVKGVGLFQLEDDETLLLYIHPDQEVDVITTQGFIPATNLGDKILTEGSIGRLGGCDVVKTRKVKKVGSKYNDVIVREGALGIKLGKSVGIEEKRDASTKSSEYFADEVFVAYLANDAGAVKVVTTEA